MDISKRITLILFFTWNSVLFNADAQPGMRGNPFRSPMIPTVQTCTPRCRGRNICFLVRSGNGDARPGCITPYEAQLLRAAVSGGPSGPGTGGTIPAGPRTQPAREAIPGMDMLGVGPQGRNGFQERFQQGINGQSANAFQSGSMVPGAGLAPPTNGQSGFTDTGTNGFLDPLTGQPQFGGGSRHRSDGTMFGSGRPNNQVGFTGENNQPGTNPGWGEGSNILSRSVNTLGGSRADQLSVTTDQIEISVILRDEQGFLYYTFTPPGYAPTRVNISRDGYCRRQVPSTSPGMSCGRECSADAECQQEGFKCCPTGCDLICMPPLLRNQNQGQGRRTNAIRRTTNTNAGTIQFCQSCTSHTGCPGIQLCLPTPGTSSCQHPYSCQDE